MKIQATSRFSSILVSISGINCLDTACEVAQAIRDNFSEVTKARCWTAGESVLVKVFADDLDKSERNDLAGELEDFVADYFSHALDTDETESTNPELEAVLDTVLEALKATNDILAAFAK